MRAIINPTAPFGLFLGRNPKSSSYIKWDPHFQLCSPKLQLSQSANSRFHAPSSAHPSSPAITYDFGSGVFHGSQEKLEKIEERVEKVIYACRFVAILAVWGSLVGSFLCFIKGCSYVAASFQEYFVNRGKVIFSLVEALGTTKMVGDQICERAENQTWPRDSHAASYWFL